MRLLTDNSTIPNRVGSVMELFRQQIHCSDSPFARAPCSTRSSAARLTHTTRFCRGLMTCGLSMGLLLRRTACFWTVWSSSCSACAFLIRRAGRRTEFPMVKPGARPQRRTFPQKTAAVKMLVQHVHRSNVVEGKTLTISATRTPQSSSLPKQTMWSRKRLCRCRFCAGHLHSHRRVVATSVGTRTKQYA